MISPARVRTAHIELNVAGRFFTTMLIPDIDDNLPSMRMGFNCAINSRWCSNTNPYSDPPVNARVVNFVEYQESAMSRVGGVGEKHVG